MNTTTYRRAYPVKVNSRQDITSDTHPVRQAILSCLGSYKLEAVVEEDLQAKSAMKGQQGLVAFVATLLKDGRVIAQGHGSSIINKTNKWMDRAISGALNGALADAFIRAKLLNTFQSSPEVQSKIDEAYRTKANTEEPITERQKSYLTELVHINVPDEAERQRWESEMVEFTKDEASMAIQSFTK